MMNLPSRMFLKKFSAVCVLLAINAGVFSALHVIIPAFAVCCTSLGLLVFYLIFFHLSYPLMKKLLLSEQINSENKAVFITGCDHGFGNSLAKRLDARGFHVFAACLFPEGPGATDLKNACSEKLKIVYLDVAKGESVEKAAYFVKQNLGTSMLWAIVNNAGIFKAFWSELSPIDSYRECFEVNSLGPVRVTNAFLPLLKKSKGRVINVTSFAGKHPLPCHAPYAMSKFAAVAFTECLSLEMNAWGIPVVEIEPEMFRTNLSDANVVNRAVDEGLKKISPQVLQSYGEEFVEQMKFLISLFTKYSSPKIHLVVDAMESAVMDKYPEHVYKARRNFFMNVFLQIAIYSPYKLYEFVQFRFFSLFIDFSLLKAVDDA